MFDRRTQFSLVLITSQRQQKVYFRLSYGMLKGLINESTGSHLGEVGRRIHTKLCSLQLYNTTKRKVLHYSVEKFTLGNKKRFCFKYENFNVFWLHKELRPSLQSAININLKVFLVFSLSFIFLFLCLFLLSFFFCLFFPLLFCLFLFPFFFFFLFPFYLFLFSFFCVFVSVSYSALLIHFFSQYNFSPFHHSLLLTF